MQSESQTEEALMAAYVAGDKRAFGELFARLGPRVHGFFMRAFGNTAVADDLLQTTFLKLHRARADYRPDLPLRPWVFAIAARVRTDELRRRYRLAEDAGDDELDAAAEAQAREQLAGAAADGQRDDLVASVRRAVDALPESQRLVVHLHRYEGMTFPEIARVLGTTEGAVKLRAFRAYERLREALRALLASEEAA
jgi:RNA polymerase sigma-70 factor (ECF subfamily)